MPSRSLRRSDSDGSITLISGRGGRAHGGTNHRLRRWRLLGPCGRSCNVSDGLTSSYLRSLAKPIDEYQCKSGLRSASGRYPLRSAQEYNNRYRYRHPLARMQREGKSLPCWLARISPDCENKTLVDEMVSIRFQAKRRISFQLPRDAIMSNTHQSAPQRHAARCPRSVTLLTPRHPGTPETKRGHDGTPEAICSAARFGRTLRNDPCTILRHCDMANSARRRADATGRQRTIGLRCSKSARHSRSLACIYIALQQWLPCRPSACLSEKA